MFRRNKSLRSAARQSASRISLQRASSGIIATTLIFLASSVAAQQLQPRVSSDPYFQAKRAIPNSPVVAPLQRPPESTPKSSLDPAPKLEHSRNPGPFALTPDVKPDVPKTGDSHFEAHAVSYSEPVGEAFQPGQVIAIVGGEPVFVADMLLEINQILAKFMPNATESIKVRERPNLIRALAPKYVDQKMMAVDTKKNLPEKVEWESLIEQASADFDEKALPILIERSGVKSPTEYDAHLRMMGSSLRKMRRVWSEEQIIRYFLSKKVEVDPQISRQDMLAYYESHLADYSKPARTKWEEITIRFDRSPSHDAAFQKIVAMGNEIVYGASFAAVAKRDSHGFTAHRGGEYDWTTKGSLVNKTIEGAIFSLPPNQLSDLIETDSGVYIVRVVEREEAAVTPFLDAQTEIKEGLLAEKREESLKGHIEKLRKKIPVELLVEPPPTRETAQKE